MSVIQRFACPLTMGHQGRAVQVKQVDRSRMLSCRLRQAILGHLLAERHILTTQDFVLIGDSLDALLRLFICGQHFAERSSQMQSPQAIIMCCHCHLHRHNMFSDRAPECTTTARASKQPLLRPWSCFALQLLKDLLAQTGAYPDIRPVGQLLDEQFSLA